MLDKLKQIGQLKSLQDEMKQEKYSAEINGVKVTVNGSLIIEEVRLNHELSVEVQEQAVKDCINEVIKKTQQAMAQKMMGMGF